MDARKVQPDSDGGTSVPFVQTSIDFEHLFPHMPLPHLDNIIHSSHFDNAKNLQGHCSSDGAVFRSFQQLLMDASSGVLCSSFSNAALSPLGAFDTIQNGSHTHMTFDTPEEFTQQDVPDDGYSAGTESEHDTVSPNHSLERIDEDNNIHISNSENDDYVAIFSDSIGQDDFMSGRDFDYGDFAVGIDDTDLNASDLENVSFGKDDVDICPGPNFSDLCTEDNVATADHSVAPAEKINMSNDKEIHVSLLGDCGCSDHAIAHEISSLYQDGVSRGFFKRQRLGSFNFLILCFGDVVTFDTTYCTNAYKMPFGLFVGVNNHFQTTIFAGVLMKSETTESFKWVFKEFLKLMRGDPPQTVLTDQCKAMTIALGQVWPDTFHLWCKWHVFKNIREHLGPTYTKNAAFRDELYSIANEMLTKEEFEQAWQDLCVRYKLTENPFMIRTFQCRCKWAKPWSKGNFCGGMTSTQRSESANMMLKKFVPRNSSLHNFVSQYSMLLQDRDMEEGRQEDQTKQLVTKHSRLWPIERHAKTIYTKATFILFRKQVDKASSFVVSGKGRDFFVVSHHNPSEKQTYYKKSYRVYLIECGARYYCECGLFEHLGILCCHTLRLMICLNIKKIPEAHILTRWTRNAKDVLPEHLKPLQNKKPATEPLSIWQTQLNATALEVVTKGNTDRETIAAVLKHLKAASKEVDEILLSRAEPVASQCIEQDVLDIATDIEEIRGNKYGASGSSATLSDSEILNIKAPLVDRKSGRPRVKRLRSSGDIASKKVSSRGNVRQSSTLDQQKSSTTVERTIPNNKNFTRGNTRSKCKSSHNTSSDKNAGLPVQTTFCTKCRNPGHTRNRCDSNSTQTSKKARNINIVVCSKCGLKGHNGEDCLVADVEDSFFK